MFLTTTVGIAGNVLGQMLRKRARHRVIAAAWGGAEDDGDGLAFVEIGRRLRQRRDRPRDREQTIQTSRGGKDRSAWSFSEHSQRIMQLSYNAPGVTASIYQ